MADWEFTTEGFRDPEEVRRRHVNGLGGARLAGALRAHLDAWGLPCGEVYPEDFGWAFEATGPEGLHLCAVALEPGAGGVLTGHALTDKRRTVLDRLLGRRREAPDEAVPLAIEAFLRGHPEIRDLA
ncbi:hypothetical protein [Rubellimicrobium mesophilum]|nr:hypothetical protein [Rubellimicrobium mesophilum]